LLEGIIVANLINQQFLLKSRPEGEPKATDFELVETAMTEPGENEVLTRTIYLSLDPYMRGRMNAGKSYAPRVELNSVMVGSTVSQVVQSCHPQFSEGDFVLGYNGWQTYGVSNGETLRKLDPAQAPISYALGILGMPGMTAYFALLDIGQPQLGETVVVSAAAGAVGSVVGQIAKIKGCRAVGIAGGEEKCNFVVKELGFDACIDRKTQELDSALQTHCPDGIDVYFDNTAGAILEAVLQHINLKARIPLVGLISQYNAVNKTPGPDLMPLLVYRALIKGFLVGDYLPRQNEFLQEVSQWVQAGKIRYKEDMAIGLENAPNAFIGLLHGKNFGKLIIRVSEDPTK
jgi:NADPH-dependent curcumin reductase